MRAAQTAPTLSVAALWSAECPLATGGTRRYRGQNCMKDIMSASAAWQNLTGKAANDGALRTAFDKLDLDKSGKIDASELKLALVEGPMGSELGVTDGELEAIASTMISWADVNDDGEIDFEEYKKILNAAAEHEIRSPL